MCNKIKDISIKKHTYYFFNDINNIKKFDPNNIKIDEKSYKNILIYYIGYVTIKDSKYVKINSENSSYLIVDKANGYFEESTGNKYLMLVPTNENKEKNLKNEKLWSKIRDLIRLITNISDNYDKKYVKIKFNSDGELSLDKTIEIPSMIIVARAIFHENNKYSPKVFLDECLYEM